MYKAAALLAWVLGLGFGVPGVVAIWHFARDGAVWTLLGLPTYGHGPFEAIGLPTSIPLLAAFVVVCVAEVVTGGLLWAGRRSGVVLSFAVVPFELAFWIGFALPFGPPVGLLRVVLVLLGLRAGAGRNASPGASVHTSAGAAGTTQRQPTEGHAEQP
ncbi:hypothetical protein [Prauserella muralis]|uniref:Uncharacterized protein n=1 Tax=Prauserella muralis TaxID=588067 RepID=A0A2V4B7N3_9PSEU|nr:hypothetical protein [Prauserella muralis]PXY31131.1 hypothetical protein BAY60_01580 [Prauserella muralis]TWE14578.1 hypothetical protein FHX69_6733 [Prauserella muralis]